MEKTREKEAHSTCNNQFSKVNLPRDFLFGVANSGYQTEGGYNSSDCPHNNFAQWEITGKVEPTGDACRFWDRHDEHIALAKSLGLNAFRMSIEWARVQPSLHQQVSALPTINETDIENYASIVSKIMDAGMTPIVTLHHFTHPAWCGTDLWLQEGMALVFVEYAISLVRRINEHLLKAGKKPLSHLITLNEPNILPLLTYMVGEHPHETRGFGAARKAMDTMLMAHVLLYDKIHNLYEEQGWQRPTVTFNTFCTAIYEFDRAFFDLVRATSNLVEKRGLKDYLAMRRDTWNRRFDELSCFRWGRYSWQRLYFMNYRFFCSLLFDPLSMKRTIEALYASTRKEKIDAIGLDIYDPFVIGSPYIRIPRPGTNEPMFRPQWWAWRHDPEHFRTILRAHHDGNFDLPIHILETTIAHRQGKGGKAIPRIDGQGRGPYLQWSIREVMQAICEGIPVKAYCYWSLTDNYEWGSYEPRLGLYEYDYKNGKILDKSGLGEEAGKLYGEIVRALREDDHEKAAHLLAL